MNELQLTQQCFLHYNKEYRGKRLFRIKNELDNHPRKSQLDKIKQLSENKATGVNKGIADFVFIDSNGDSHWIELKVDDGKQSPEQKDFQAIVKNYYICRSLEDFKKEIKKIIDG